MKKFLLIPLLILFVTTGCKKDPVINSVAPPAQPAPSPTLHPTPPPPVNPVNNPLKAYAGLDVGVPLPANFCVLYGGATHAVNIESYSWNKISGPASFVIENPRSKQTKITNLEKGTYEFELTVIHDNGISAKDTVSIHVYEPRIAGANEFIFKNMQWICPMGCSLLIENFNLYLANGTLFKVFVKSATSTNWIEVIPLDKWTASNKYFYTIHNNSLLIYADFPDNEGVPVDVKITF